MAYLNVILLVLVISILAHSLKLVSKPSVRLSTVLSATTDIDYGLTPKLQQYSDALKNVNDDRMRYQQLLFLAAKCEPMDNALKIEENKVPGCLSTVHVHATETDGKIFYKGDSDAQLTKGLVALLVNGLSGCTNEEIQRVKPEFIQYAGIGNSLTPGRNNGFLNMLKLMKIKASQLSHSSPMNASTTSTTNSGEVNITGGRIYNSIKTKLSMLKPTVLEIEDESSKHAGHAGTKGLNSSETHFNVKVVAACFDGLSLVQRHKMIYTLLANEMSNGVHALSISAKTPQEI